MPVTLLQGKPYLHSCEGAQSFPGVNSDCVHISTAVLIKYPWPHVSNGIAAGSCCIQTDSKIFISLLALGMDELCGKYYVSDLWETYVRETCSGIRERG